LLPSAVLLSAGRAAISLYLLPAGRTAANPQQRSVVDDRKDGQTDKQTDKRMPDRYTNSASHIMRAVSKMHWYIIEEDLNNINFE